MFNDTKGGMQNIKERKWQTGFQFCNAYSWVYAYPQTSTLLFSEWKKVLE